MSEDRWVHPDAAGLLRAIRRSPGMHEMGVAAARANAAKRTTAPPYEDVAAVSDHDVASSGGQFPVRLYVPFLDAPGSTPVVVYLHAGGWILGDLDHSDRLCRRLANRSGCAVVNVGYRLAPEHPHPAALDDAETAFHWVLANAEQLGFDRTRVGLAGESSGGHMAALTTVRLLHTAQVGPAFLLLLCPVIDPTMTSPSWRDLGDDFPPVRDQMAWMWRLSLAGIDPASADVNPFLATDLAGHPPTLIVTAELDPLRDEAERYGHHLADAGVTVSVRRELGLIHAFANLGGVLPAGTRAYDAAASAVRSALVEGGRR